MAKIGIYPAAFDPIHKGHLAFAEAARVSQGLDKVFFLPEPNPRHKQAVKALKHRLHMVQLATADNHRFGTVVLDKKGMPLHDMWPLIVARFAGEQLYMLLGSNVAERLASWPNVADMAKTVPKFVIATADASSAETTAMIKTLQSTKKLETDYSILDATDDTYHSADIRLSLKRGHAPRGLTPAVLEYIQQNQLYMSDPS